MTLFYFCILYIAIGGAAALLVGHIMRRGRAATGSNGQAIVEQQREEIYQLRRQLKEAQTPALTDTLRQALVDELDCGCPTLLPSTLRSQAGGIDQ